MVKHLFPDQPKANYKKINVPNLSPFTLEELWRAVRKLKPGKSGGPDGIPPEVVKAAVEIEPRLILGLMNECLSKGNFPRRWKRGRLVLIPKPGKPEGAPNVYRALCLLDTLGSPSSWSWAACVPSSRPTGPSPEECTAFSRAGLRLAWGWTCVAISATGWTGFQWSSWWT